MAKDYLTGREFNKTISNLLDRVIASAPFIAEAAASEIAELAIEYAKENIETGRNMAAHSKYTPDLTEKLSGGTRNTNSVLEETGELKESIYVVEKLLSSDGIYIVIGSNLEYAAYHEEGFTSIIPRINKSKTVPARPFMRPAVERAVKSSLRYGLESRIRKAFTAAMSKKSWKKFF